MRRVQPKAQRREGSIRSRKVQLSARIRKYARDALATLAPCVSDIENSGIEAELNEAHAPRGTICSASNRDRRR
jgi:hypothetical protein